MASMLVSSKKKKEGNILKKEARFKVHV